VLKDMMLTGSITRYVDGRYNALISRTSPAGGQH